MKRVVLMAVAALFLMALPAFAQDSDKPIAPKKQIKVQTDQEQTMKAEPAAKKGNKPKKQVKAQTDQEQTMKAEPAAKKGLKPKKTKKVQTDTEIQESGQKKPVSKP